MLSVRSLSSSFLNNNNNHRCIPLLSFKRCYININNNKNNVNNIIIQQQQQQQYRHIRSYSSNNSSNNSDIGSSKLAKQIIDDQLSIEIGSHLRSHITSQADKNYIFNNYLVSLIGQIYLENGETPIIDYVLPEFINYLDNLSVSELELYQLTDYSKDSMLKKMPQVSVDKLPIPIWFSSIILSSIGNDIHLTRLQSLLRQQGRNMSEFQLVQETGRGSKNSMFFYVLYNQKKLGKNDSHEILGYGAASSMKQAQAEATTDSLVRQLCYPQNK
ncbi:hypothetical protein PPL_00869 [Heterostelium album PN500]|uniref:Uncharacterized protein n=1 Tax=Heterostelium pallidum (strain ATCC 26659 / Pp 5 / PN500) TaxID=670386 RepID=D3AYV0_HETP5|nr:hypothetical protein PPL_00869 [Heterostelium album PN500]EFA85640.1 hypothetical protein PPL_00869 [Heterostelium album PN500]|eukprot:XP_020437747.1 hypothetical protein PPL_00869 [Heterostelium album PN500]